MGRGDGEQQQLPTYQDGIQLWLDDRRTPPDGWVWVKTVEEAIAALEQGVSVASLDNDLGLDEQGEELPQGRKLVYHMAENEVWPSEGLFIHSSNSVAVDYMSKMIARYGPYSRQVGVTRFYR